MNTQILNIISPKSLEKQLKVVDSRIQTLQAEIDELTKIRNACLVLLGNSVEETPERIEVEAPKASKKKPEKRNAEEVTESDDEFNRQANSDISSEDATQ